MYELEPLSLLATLTFLRNIFRKTEKSFSLPSVSDRPLLLYSESRSLQHEEQFAVNPDLTSMLLLYLDRIPQGCFVMGARIAKAVADGASNKCTSSSFCVLFCLSFIVCFCVFSVPDRYKQKHNSKKAEEGIWTCRHLVFLGAPWTVFMTGFFLFLFPHASGVGMTDWMLILFWDT